MSSHTLPPVLSFKGRIGRLPFLGWSVALLLAQTVVGGVVLFMISESASMPGSMQLLIGLVLLALFVLTMWASFSLMVRRAHDMNTAGGYVIIGYLIGMILSSSDRSGLWGQLLVIALGLWLLLKAGDAGDNQFGPPPGGDKKLAQAA